MVEYIFALNDQRGLEERRERVVRCRDCIHQKLEYGNRGRMTCKRNCCAPWPVEPDGFCAWGKERGEE